MTSDGTRHIVHIQLDEKTPVRRRPEVEHERRVAIYDLIEENYFAPVGDFAGPFNLHLRTEDNRLVFDIRAEDDTPLCEVRLPLTPFRRMVKDYFLVCGSYYEAIRHAPPARIEAIDMGRRGLHDEGAALLMDLLGPSIELDQGTARRLFTLLCVLHVKG